MFVNFVRILHRLKLFVFCIFPSLYFQYHSPNFLYRKVISMLFMSLQVCPCVTGHGSPRSISALYIYLLFLRHYLLTSFILLASDGHFSHVYVTQVHIYFPPKKGSHSGKISVKLAGISYNSSL